MNTQELIELAVLDAMGLLDEQEREAFDAAFAGAPPAIQAQVRREQTRLSLSQDILPDVEPPAGLRAMVVDAVRRAMETPGERRHRHVRAGLVALMPARQVSPLWRAASVGFAAAAVVFGSTFLHLRGQFDSLARAVESDRLLSEMQGAIGSPYVVALLTDSQTSTREFVPMPGVTRGQVRLWSNPAWGEGDQVLLAMTNMPANLPGVSDPLRVYAYENGALVGEALHEFENRAGFQMVRFQAPQAGSMRLAIAAADADGVYRPLFVTPDTGGLAWAEIDRTGDDPIA